MGLPIFILLLYGAIRLSKHLVYFKNIFYNHSFAIVALPILLHLISICFLDTTFSRHILPAIPLFVIISAYGLREIKKSKIFCNNKVKFSFIFLVIFAYQLIYVSSIEYYFLFETRESATHWIKKNIPPGTEFTTARFVNIPLLKKNYQTTADFNSPYLILHETYYYRYLRSRLNPFEKYPTWDKVYHGSYDYFIKIQELFKGQLNYKLIKKFRIKSLTPEMSLYKKFLGTYPLFIGDTLIYKRIDA